MHPILGQRSAVLPLAAVLLLCLNLAGCAGKAPAEADAWLKDKDAVMAGLEQARSHHDQVQAAQAQLDEKQTQFDAKLEELNQRILDLEKRSYAQMAQIAALEQELKKRHTKPGLTKAEERKLEKKIAKIQASIQETSALATAAAEKAGKEREAEKNKYTGAYLALKSGRYDESAAAFEKLIAEYPKGEYTDQTYYWLGESYYAQHRLDKAITAFSKVANDHPQSSKHAAALLKLGLAHEEAQHPGDAKAAYRRLIKEHPDSAAAVQARQRLQALQP